MKWVLILFALNSPGNYADAPFATEAGCVAAGEAAVSSGDALRYRCLDTLYQGWREGGVGTAVITTLDKRMDIFQHDLFSVCVASGSCPWQGSSLHINEGSDGWVGGYTRDIHLPDGGTQ